MSDRNVQVSSWPGAPAREVWYGFVGDELRVLWYRYTLLSTTDGFREARLWTGYTERNGESWFATRAYGTGAVTTTDQPFRLDVSGNELTSKSATGSVEDIDWNLEWTPDDVTFTPLRSRLLSTAVARCATGQHWSNNEAIRVDGTVTVAGETVEFSKAAGHQGHTVGSTPPQSWRWVHCGTFADPTVVLEALSVGGRLSVCFRHNGQTYRLNRLHNLVGPLSNRTEYDRPGHWSFRAAGDGLRLSVMVRADPDRWHLVRYRTTDGTRYNAHCPLSTVRLKYEYEDQTRTLESSGGRAEWVGTEPPVEGEYRAEWE